MKKARALIGFLAFYITATLRDQVYIILIEHYIFFYWSFSIYLVPIESLEMVIFFANQFLWALVYFFPHRQLSFSFGRCVIYHSKGL